MSSRPVTQYDSVEAIEPYIFHSFQVLQDGRQGDTECDYKTVSWDELIAHAFPDTELLVVKDSKYLMECSLHPVTYLSQLVYDEPQYGSHSWNASSGVYRSETRLRDDEERYVAVYGIPERESPFKAIRLLGCKEESEDQLASFPMYIRCDARAVVSTFTHANLWGSKLVATRMSATSTFRSVDGEDGPSGDCGGFPKRLKIPYEAWIRTEKLSPRILTEKDSRPLGLHRAGDSTTQAWREGKTTRCSAFLKTCITESPRMPWGDELINEALKLEEREASAMSFHLLG